MLADYYRCPDDAARLALARELSADSGFFHFGPGTICYGQSCSGFRARSPEDRLYDTWQDLRRDDDDVLRVPFDPLQVIDNLRLERYTGNSHVEGPHRISLGHLAYYALRRFLPFPLRRQIQRAYLRGWHTLPFPRWPVDHTVEDILERLVARALEGQARARLPFIWFWPDGAPSCAILTHDVETAPGRDACRWLMDTDEGHGMRSSFQIVPEGRYLVPASFLEEVRDRGFEINVHDLNHDGLLFTSRDEFLRRAARINEHARAYGARGFRSGSLHRRPEWYDALEFAYDMSIPNAGHLEVQRGGCCTVMPYFIGRMVELPVTTTQDYSLFHILGDFSLDIWKRQIERITARYGLASFIVHPDYLGAERARRTYRALLEHLAELRASTGCWIALPGDVERWWRDRSEMRLVPEGERWRIEGPGKERARVAYAELDGDRLAYRLDG